MKIFTKIRSIGTYMTDLKFFNFVLTASLVMTRNVMHNTDINKATILVSWIFANISNNVLMKIKQKIKLV